MPVLSRAVLLTSLVACTLFSPLHAADADLALERITADVQFLSSDHLEGRGVGTAGLQKAAEYIRDEFRQLGLQGGAEDGSYFQTFSMLVETRIQEEATTLQLTGPEERKIELELGEDYQPIVLGGAGAATAPIIFAGYGINALELGYNDYADADVRGKIVLLIRREPQQDDVESALDGVKVTPHSYLLTKLRAAKDHGAAGVLLVNDPYTTKRKGQDTLAPSDAGGSGDFEIPFAHVTQSVVNDLLQQHPLHTSSGRQLASLAEVEQYIDRHFEPVTQPMSGWSATLQVALSKVRADVHNVVGVLEGGGPRAGETIVIGAHYDHLGFGGFGSRQPEVSQIHNGADDNASGTAAMLEIARRFAAKPSRPPHRLVFIAFGAEERGLIGSNYYLQHPIFPLEKTVAMFNFDMVGRLRDNELTVYGVKSAKEFEDLVQKANQEHELSLEPVEGVVAASDHFGFFQKGIPVFHFFSGFSEEYHTPEDDLETLNLPGIVSVVDYAEDLLQAVMELPAAPQFVQIESTTAERGDMPFLGVVPDYTSEGDGLRLSEVGPGSPAERGGLKAGDVIIQFGELAVADLEGLAAGLRRYKAGQQVPIVVRRGETQEELTVTLGAARGR